MATPFILKVLLLTPILSSSAVQFEININPYNKEDAASGAAGGKGVAPPPETNATITPNAMAFKNLLASEPICLKMKVNVYLSGHCSDTKKFILNQLRPFMNKYEKYVYPRWINFVSFGKSKVGNGGADSHHCQFGPAECVSNIYIACGFKIFSDDFILPFLYCMFEKQKEQKKSVEATHKVARGCVSGRHKLKRRRRNQLLKCQTGEEGQKLFKMAGEKSQHIFNKPGAFVPTIEIDGDSSDQKHKNRRFEVACAEPKSHKHGNEGDDMKSLEWGLG